MTTPRICDCGVNREQMVSTANDCYFKHYYACNRGRRISETKAWQKANWKRTLSYKAKWRAKNPEHQKALEDRWLAVPENKKRKTATIAAWVKANPDLVRLKARLYQHRRRTGDRVSRLEWLALIEEYDGTCAYSGTQWASERCLGRTDKLTIDHVIPLSRGGPNTINNIVPACQSCNSKKGDKTYGNA